MGRHLSGYLHAIMALGIASTAFRQATDEMFELPNFHPTGRSEPVRARKNYRPRHSRYMPHIGAKERARHAGKPDGPMHVTGHDRRLEMTARFGV